MNRFMHDLGYAWIDPYRTKWAGLESCIADPVCATKGWYLASQGINLGATSLILPYIVEYDGDDDCTGVTCAAGHYCYDDADTHCEQPPTATLIDPQQLP